MSPKSPSRAGRVTLVGPPNVGKSTLLNALLGERIAIVSPHPQTTREPVHGVRTVDDAQFVFVDTPGVHTPRSRLGQWMNEVARQRARDADAVVLVTEAPRDATTETRSRTATAAVVAELSGAPVVLAVNKIDRLREKSALLPFIAALAEMRPFAAVVPLSGRTGQGVPELLDELRVLLPEQDPLYDADTLTDQPARFFVAELVREQVLRHTRQEVPHGVAVVVERWDESTTPQRIEAIIHVSREAHTKILVGARGQMLKSIGMAARTRVEALLGRRVHLALRVQATPDWMNDTARLRDLGFGPIEP